MNTPNRTPQRRSDIMVISPDQSPGAYASPIRSKPMGILTPVSSSKALKVLGSTPPNASRNIGMKRIKRKFDDAMDENDDYVTEEEVKPSFMQSQLSNIKSMLNISKKFKKEDKEPINKIQSPSEARLAKKIEKRRSGELRRRKSGDKITSLRTTKSTIGLKKKKISVDKRGNRKKTVMSPNMVISPEKLNEMSEEELEDFKERFFSDAVYGSNSPVSRLSSPTHQRVPAFAGLESLNEQKTLTPNKPGRSFAFKLELDKIPKFDEPDEQQFTPHTPRNDFQSERVLTPRPTKQKESFELQEVLAEPLCREYLAEFLKTEYCEENMSFYENVIVYKTWKNKRQRLNHAMDIYKEFVSLDAPRQINIDLSAVNIVRSRIRDCEEHEPDEHLVGLFDNICDHIEHVMTDSYSRFIMSTKYNEMVRMYNNNARKLLVSNSLNNMKEKVTTPLKALNKTFSAGNVLNFR
ncbi:GTPase activator protein [Acrasis kona]|uniref:GTPase activator protein n=1 Tax=Acrasis kona TaxID=1008807 RepID=A0AAW2ZHC4_9EUKA